jgi:NADH dehydrogenase/NADH:ubiquinone oxidoreductase subunit G
MLTWPPFGSRSHTRYPRPHSHLFLTSSSFISEAAMAYPMERLIANLDGADAWTMPSTRHEDPEKRRTRKAGTSKRRLMCCTIVYISDFANPRPKRRRPKKKEGRRPEEDGELKGLSKREKKTRRTHEKKRCRSSFGSQAKPKRRV